MGLGRPQPSVRGSDGCDVQADPKAVAAAAAAAAAEAAASAAVPATQHREAAEARASRLWGSAGVMAEPTIPGPHAAPNPRAAPPADAAPNGKGPGPLQAPAEESSQPPPITGLSGPASSAPAGPQLFLCREEDKRHVRLRYVFMLELSWEALTALISRLRMRAPCKEGCMGREAIQTLRGLESFVPLGRPRGRFRSTGKSRRDGPSALHMAARSTGPSGPTNAPCAALLLIYNSTSCGETASEQSCQANEAKTL